MQQPVYSRRIVSQILKANVNYIGLGRLAITHDIEA